MSAEEARRLVLAVLRRIAPEADLAAIAPAVDFRAQLDLDSMDFLEFASGLAKAAETDIPERDYPRISSLDGCVDYLRRSAVRP